MWCRIWNWKLRQTDTTKIHFSYFAPGTTLRHVYDRAQWQQRPLDCYKKCFWTFYSSKNSEKKIVPQISILQLFLKDHVTLKTGVMMLLMFLLYFWSNKCRRVKHKRLLLKTFKILPIPNFWTAVYICFIRLFW